MAKILIVDDERHILEYYTEVLSEDGHQVITQDSGYQLLSKIAFHQPDLVILDIKLVDWDGLELLQEIKSFDLTELKIKIRRAVDARSPALFPGAEVPLSPTSF